MAVNGHARRLDQIARKMPTPRPTTEAIVQEYDRLIALYKARQAGVPGVDLTPKWPNSQLDAWMNEIIAELAAEGST